MRIFDAAIKELNSAGRGVSTPKPFRSYSAKLGIKKPNTAQYISIQSYDQLQQELKDEGVMVFRLGKPPRANGTQFALAKVQTDWRDYFIFDKDHLPKKESFEWRPETHAELLAFNLLPSLTENSLINYCISSGLFNKVLGLSTKFPAAPATGNSTYTFKFLPHQAMSEVLTHTNGQVEIDALFTGDKEVSKCLYVLEAKVSKKYGSISKHKLVYPVLSLANKVPDEYKIVPVYLRAIGCDKDFNLLIMELSLPDPRKSLVSIDSLSVKRATQVSLRFP